MTVPERFKTRFYDLTRACACSFTWKAGPNLVGEPVLAGKGDNHCRAFCAQVKSCPARQAACVRNDVSAISAKMQRQRRFFLHRCHAGAVEIVIPFFNELHCLGALMAGPFRVPGAAPVFPESAPGWAELEPFDRRRARALVRVARAFFADAAYEIWQYRQSRAAAALPAARDPRVRRALAVIANNLSRHLPAAEVAAACNLSGSYFLHLFTRQLGMSFSAYLMQSRLNLSLSYLRDPEIPLAAIASMCGFTDQSYFTAMFRKLFGSTPRAYRLRCQAAGGMPPAAIPARPAAPVPKGQRR